MKLSAEDMAKIMEQYHQSSNSSILIPNNMNPSTEQLAAEKAKTEGEKAATIVKKDISEVSKEELKNFEDTVIEQINNDYNYSARADRFISNPYSNGLIKNMTPEEVQTFKEQQTELKKILDKRGSNNTANNVYQTAADIDQVQKRLEEAGKNPSYLEGDKKIAEKRIAQATGKVESLAMKKENLQGLKKQLQEETGAEMNKAFKSEIVEKTGKEVAESFLKGKGGRLLAGIGVGAFIISNLNRNKGQQSNAELYNQNY